MKTKTKFLYGALLSISLFSFFCVLRDSSFINVSVLPVKRENLHSVALPDVLKESLFTMPVNKVPKWLSIPQEDWDASFEDIADEKLMNLPIYDPSILKIPPKALNVSTGRGVEQRNTQLTYIVPYMGNYKFDGVEYAGSHSGTDIRLPLHTPIYSIGDGVVVTATKSSVGFGNHVVIQHDNVPSYEDPKVLTTYYSSYSHLSDFFVQEGEKVTKGQNIGLSGQTGAASLPHLHFQIDNDKAPWHPYWPFSFQEAADAGFSYSEAVSAGLNKDKAIAVTINPLLYIQKYSSTISETLHGSAKPSPETSLRRVQKLRSEFNFYGKGF